MEEPGPWWRRIGKLGTSNGGGTIKLSSPLHYLYLVHQVRRTPASSRLSSVGNLWRTFVVEILGGTSKGGEGLFVCPNRGRSSVASSSTR